MIIVLNGLLKDIAKGKKNPDMQYVTFLDDDGGEVKLSSDAVDMTAIPRLVPVKVTAVVNGFNSMQYGQSFKATKITVDRLKELPSQNGNSTEGGK